MLIVFIGLIIRLFLSLLFSNVVNHDTIGWATVGVATLQGDNIYPSLASEYHAFFPLFLYINALAAWLQQFGISFMLVIKIICSLFDAGIVYLIYLLSKKNKTTAIMYALNPISIMIVCIHGQFESITVFFLLLGVYMLRGKKPTISGFVLGFAVAFKTWPLLFSIPLIKRVWKKRYFFYIVSIPLIVSIVYVYLYNSKISDIVRIFLSYRGQTGNYGLGLFSLFFIHNSNYMSKIFPIISHLFLVLFLLFSLFNRKKDTIDEILDQMLFFFVLSPTMGIQYFMWIVPFLIIKRPRLYWIFIIMATVYIGNVNLYWILGGNMEFMLKYMVQFGLLTWGSLVLIALFRGHGLKRYIIVAQNNLTDYKKSKK